MRRQDRFMIAPLTSGQETNVRPWLIPDNAFEKLENAYVFRGRVRKRFGGRLIQCETPVSASFLANSSRLKINLGMTASASIPAGVTGAIGQQFSIGDQLFTVYQANGAMHNTAGAVTGTFNTATGAYVFTGAIGSAIYFYPSTPVMGIVNYENSAVNEEQVIAFDRNYAYQYTATGWERLTGEAVAGDAQWTSTDSEFFLATNYRGALSSNFILFVTNFNDTDRIRYYNGTQWATFNQDINASGDFIVTAKVIIPFKGRLLLFNTVENLSGNNTAFRNRVRFSQAGSPFDATAWYDTTGNKGGFVDATTKESIIGAQYLKDRLIVFFERSTWELVYIGNYVMPFRWQKINTELGVESTHSLIPFDKAVLGVGHVGIQACNGANVERIDEKIPNTVFNISNVNDAVKRVSGIRDFYSEMVYWTYPSIKQSDTNPWPNKVLVYNYNTGSWAINDDSITAFGYFQSSANTSSTWETFEQTWGESETTWGGINREPLFRNIIAGNQQGFTFIIDRKVERNAAVLQISNISFSAPLVTLTIVNHNLVSGFNGVGDYIAIENAQGVTGLNDAIYSVYDVVDKDTIRITNAGFAGTYSGGGIVTRVSNINILTKQYNFYLKEGYNCAVNKVDFLLDKTVRGQVSVDYMASSSDRSLLTDGTATQALIGDGVLEVKPYTMNALESSQTRIWHPIYPLVNGECIQLRLYMNDTQLTDTDVAWSAFELHAMTFYANPTGSRLQ